MAETRLADIIIPEVFTDATLEPSIHKNRFVQSGIMENSAQLSGLLQGGGTTFNLKFFQDVVDNESEVPSETVAQSIDNITQGAQIARRLERTRAWGANALSSVESGDDVLAAIQARVVGYWTTEYDKMAVSTAQGVYASNAAGAGDLTNDITASGSPSISDDAVIDAQALLGENATVGRGDLNNGDFVGMAVHPDIYTTLRKNDAIDFIPISGQIRPVAFYMGMRLIVDKRLPVLSSGPNTYLSVIFKSSALMIGQSGFGYEPTSVDRKEDTGFGIDELYTRRVLAVHPVGFAWQDASVAGVAPTNAEIQTAANWSQVYETENIRMTFLVSEA